MRVGRCEMVGGGKKGGRSLRPTHQKKDRGHNHPPTKPTEDGELHITLQKMNKGEVWPSALAGAAEVRKWDCVSLVCFVARSFCGGLGE